MDMKPTWARTHEHVAYTSYTTRSCIYDLQNFYLMTGDRRYLKPIPYAIEWLEKSTLKMLDDGRHQLANYYEIGTNKPLFMHITGKFNEKGYALYHWDNDQTGTNYTLSTFNIQAMKKAYENISAVTAGDAVARYKARKTAKPAVPQINPVKVEELINALDKRGSWVEEISVYGSTNNDPDYPWANTKIQGITVNSYIRNMKTFIHYLKNIK